MQQTMVRLNKKHFIDETPISEVVHNFMAHFTDLWWASDIHFPDLGRSYALKEQIQKGRALEKELDRLITKLRRPPRNETERLAVQERIGDMLVLLAKTGLEFEDEDIAAIRSYGFADIALEFARMARTFDPQVSANDIYQASRNVWSMNIMQLLLGLPVQMTPSIFAYSMLYPYSDNYLDDPSIPSETKVAFNERFWRRLAGENISPANRHEQYISELISIIESQFERASHPQIFQSLMAIHSAQAQSLNLLSRSASPYEINILGLCFEKGGTSVLADGYLVAGSLTPEEQELMFFYGVFTQMMDDLEDTRLDQKEGRLTVFSQTAGRWPLDAVTNRTFHFGHQLLERLDRVNQPAAGPFQRLIKKCIDPLLIASAGEADSYYTRPYLRELETHLPVRLDFIKKQRRKFGRMNATVIDLVEAFVKSGERSRTKSVE
jgi:hypothetical protein